MFKLKRKKAILDYYLYKGRARLLSFFLEKTVGFKKIEDIAIFNHPRDFRFSGNVVFDFSDSQILHLGDQLFYQPTIDALNKIFKVQVVTYPVMRNYFSTLGYETLTIDDLKREETENILFVSNRDSIWNMRKMFGAKNVFLGIDFVSPLNPKRVVEIIFNAVAEVLRIIDTKQDLDFKGVDLCPRVSPLLFEKYKGSPFLKLFLENSDKKFFLFNNYGASRFSGMGKERKRILEGLAKEKKKQGFLIAHIGSQKDKNEDQDTYLFVDYDLRGKYPALSLFKIFSLKNVQGVISFDSYPMHAATLSGKQALVVLKSRSDMNEEEKIRKIFVPMASCLEGLVKIKK